MKRFILVIFFAFVSINETLANTDNVEIYADACEKIIEGESKSSARLRASDKATFIAVKKIKQIDAYNTVCKNLKKYSKAQKNSYNVISKYIIIPEVNDTYEEIDGWLKFNKENNIGIIVIDIENSWLTRYRNEKPDERIIELIKYVIKQKDEMNFSRLEVCDRARYLVEESIKE